MEAGKLRHRVTIQSKTVAPDDYGGPVETWVDVATVPASVEPLQGRELANAQTVNTETTTRITMRYRADLLPSHRITFDGKYYNLHSIVDEELKHKSLVIMASQGLNEG